MISSINTLKKIKNTNRVHQNKKSIDKINNWDQRVVQVLRVTKVVKGGKKLSFRVTVVVGNRNSQIGVGVGKATEVLTAMNKGVNDAKKNIITIPLTKTNTIPHNIIGVDGASKVLLRPAGPGTGIIAGSSIKFVLEFAGIQNILAKQLGGNNLLNNARATIIALKALKTPKQVAEEREIPLERIFSYGK